MKTVLEYEGERYVLTYPCKCCGAEISTACAKGNDPFVTADNCGKDHRR